MKTKNIAILGCGTVGGGVAQILTKLKSELDQRTPQELRLTKIVELYPSKAAERFGLPLGIFCGGGKDLSPEEASAFISEIIESDDIDMVVETIGGTSDFVHDICLKVCMSGKHLISANKALLAERGTDIFKAAIENNVEVGFEAAVCAAIPIIKAIKEGFSGDSIQSLSGIFNGTSNYILSRMSNEGLEFEQALKLAQENGYAEADPTLDINGGDAGHKLIILIKLAFGVDLKMEQLSIKGIENIGKEDIDFAEEIDCKVKLICFAKSIDGKLFATVSPMMVKKANFLSGVNGATNAVRIINKYSGKHVMLGKGAGSTETASSIVADMVFISRYTGVPKPSGGKTDLEFMKPENFEFPYIVMFETLDQPGITGLVTTSFGDQDINIDTVSHNRHKTDRAIFSIATMPCTLKQIEKTIAEIKASKPEILLSKPKIFPILR